MANNKDYSYNYTDKATNVANYRQSYLNRTAVMFKYHNLPDTIPQRNLEKLLQNNGFCGVAKVNGELYAFEGGLGGEPNPYNEPTIFTVSNPALNYTADLKIDTDCIIIRNDSYMQGMLPTINRYSSMLVENDISTFVSNFNSRLLAIIAGSDNNTINSANDFLAKLVSGKLGVIADNAFLDSLKVNPITKGSSNPMNDLITQNQYIKACLLNDLGLSANTQLKKERLVQAEVENNSESLYPIIDDMLTNRRIGIEAINELFGTNITVELNSSWDMRAYNGMSIHNTKEEIDIEELTDDEKADIATDGESVANDSDSDSTDIKNKGDGTNQEVVEETEDTEETEDKEDKE